MHHWFLAFSYKYTSKKDGKVKISSFTSRGQRSTLRSMTSMKRSEVSTRQTTLLKSANKHLLPFRSYGRFPVFRNHTSGPSTRKPEVTAAKKIGNLSAFIRATLWHNMIQFDFRAKHCHFSFVSMVDPGISLQKFEWSRNYL